ncbi:protein of unknown function (plasmid) [Azospirillum baldaniorum]|uniref:Uncharacterized protein n=1 Tax=Azospirillum baldaniorum TaxID=1064539 RepID=A0A9P1JY89_9PROT|nr:protein of unknown function [Azospirillum baldaniorum]
MMVGALRPSSICPSIARLTPDSRANRSKDSPWRVRNRLRLRPRAAGIADSGVLETQSSFAALTARSLIAQDSPCGKGRITRIAYQLNRFNTA